MFSKKRKTFTAQQTFRKTNDMIGAEEEIWPFFLIPLFISFSSSLNAVNGVPSCGNNFLMNEMARGEWGFEGYVVSEDRSFRSFFPFVFLICQTPLAFASLLSSSFSSPSTFPFISFFLSLPSWSLACLPPLSLSLSLSPLLFSS